MSGMEENRKNTFFRLLNFFLVYAGEDEEGYPSWLTNYISTGDGGQTPMWGGGPEGAAGVVLIVLKSQLHCTGVESKF